MHNVIRKGQIYTQIPTGYGLASIEKFQKKYSKKDIEKLQKKLEKYQKEVAKLEAKTSRLFFKLRLKKIHRLNLKIQAIQNVLGMTPFQSNVTQEAYDQQMILAQENLINPLWYVAGALLVSGAVFYVVKNRKK